MDGGSMVIASRKHGSQKQSRAEKSEAIRQAIFFTAAKVVGEDGYADASISKITSQANVSTAGSTIISNRGRTFSSNFCRISDSSC